MKKDFKTIILITLSIIAFILLIIVLMPSKEKNEENKKTEDQLLIGIDDIVFELKGDVDYELKSNEEYVEPGYVAYIKKGEDLTDFVTVKNDYLVENGKYKIKYNLEYENIKTSLIRNITIKNVVDADVKIDEGEEITLKLNGEATTYILKNNQFKDLGASALDKNGKDISSDIITNGIVDTSKIGEYLITYTIKTKSNIEKVERKVVVYDLDYDITTFKSNNKVTLTFIVNDSYIKFLSINNEAKSVVKGKNTFQLEDNQEYTLKIFDKYNFTKEEKLNFIKPIISCSATINSSNTVVTVSSKSSDIVKYNYYFNNQKYESLKTNYTLTGNYKSVSVEAINVNNNSSKVNCNVTENKPVPYFDAGLKELNYNGWDYYLYVPSNVRQNEKKPLIIFLHGSGERGNNLKNLNSYGFSKYIKNGQMYDAFILMPQLPKGKTWTGTTSTTMSLIKKIVNDYNIDESKISLSGFSLGAVGIPDMVKANQNYFSCVVLIACSGGWKNYAKYFSNMPVKFYAGSKDTGQGNSSQTKAFYEAIKKINTNVEWTVYKNESHNVVDKVLKDGTVYNWMISQTKR